MKTVFMRTLPFAAIGMIYSLLLPQLHADPLPGRDLLKFSQQPMNSTFVVNTAGVVNIYKGHDEPSTAYGFANAANPNITQYDGTFMADDFADKLSSPVVHVKWWGSYHNDVINPNAPVNKFLIAFESDVPAPVPGFSRPGAVLQSDVVSKGPLAPGSGTFTEKLIRGPDSILNESLYEYNAELHLNQAFFEKRDTVYWLKIAALVDVPGGIMFPVNSPPPGMTQWGWHNRDYTISDPLASGLVVPGETMSVNPADGAKVWHFQDDAVTGSMRYDTTAGLPNFGIFQPPTTMQPTFYLGNGIDGASSNIPGAIGIDNFSKDLAFQLFTVNPPNVPEPATCMLLLGGVMGLAQHRRRRDR